MEKESCVSVIVPVYKVEKYLRACVESLTGQTYQNLEIILVDDGSPDNCGAICEEYAEKDRRIKVIHQENQGVSAARNTGLGIATGAYIAFVDSDDWILPHTIEKAMEAYEQTNADLVIYNIEPVYEPGFLGRQFGKSPIRDEVLSQEELINQIGENNGWYYCVAWNKLYKREVFDSLRFPVDYIHEDEAVIHHVVASCPRIATISEKLYMYRQVSGSIMASGFTVKSTDALSAFADRLWWSRKQKWTAYEKKLVVYYEEKFWEWYHLFSGKKENDLYLKRMENSLKKSLPSIWGSGQISFSHKAYLTLLRLSPRLFWAVYHGVRRIKK